MSDRKQFSAGALGIAMALSAAHIMSPADEYISSFHRKPKAAPAKPKNTKAAAQRKARKINRRNSK